MHACVFKAGGKSDKKWSCKSRSKKFRYSEVVSITSNFNLLIGEGGFGKVYLGNLNDGTQVAVKLLSSSSKQGHKEFQNEVINKKITNFLIYVKLFVSY